MWTPIRSNKRKNPIDQINQINQINLCCPPICCCSKFICFFRNYLFFISVGFIYISGSIFLRIVTKDHGIVIGIKLSDSNQKCLANILMAGLIGFTKPRQCNEGTTQSSWTDLNSKICKRIMKFNSNLMCAKSFEIKETIESNEMNWCTRKSNTL